MISRQLRNQFSKFRPPPLPVQNENSNYNQYTNNPPPPSNYGNQSGGYNNNNNSNFSGNPYGNNPSQPAQTYQPSMAGQYTGGAKQTPGNVPAGEHEHGYEWEQAREEERLANNQAPPGYDVGTGEFFR